MSILEQIREAIATTLDIDPAEVTATSSDKTLPAWDSLAHVNLMVALEDTFDIQLEPEDFPKLNSVPGIVEHLASLGIQ
jgi:acyl carrier protein